MTRPTAAQSRELAELEDHAATIARTLTILRLGLRNARHARDAKTIREIETEIRYLAERLADVRARRDALHRALGGSD